MGLDAAETLSSTADPPAALRRRVMTHSLPTTDAGNYKSHGNAPINNHHQTPLHEARAEPEGCSSSVSLCHLPFFNDMETNSDLPLRCLLLLLLLPGQFVSSSSSKTLHLSHSPDGEEKPAQRSPERHAARCDGRRRVRWVQTDCTSESRVSLMEVARLPPRVED